MVGGQALPPPVAWVPSAQYIKKRPGRTEFQRGIVASDELGRQSVRITGNQGSGVLRSMSEANCIIVLDHDQAEVKAGEWVKVLYFQGLV
jgi:molybdopterin molybdotransferase